MGNKNEAAQAVTVDTPEFERLLGRVKDHHNLFGGYPEIRQRNRAEFIDHINAHTAAVTARAVEQLQHQNADLREALNQALAAQAAAPVAASADPIVEMNVAMLRDRSAVGVKKYGTTLADNKLPLRAWLQHALEETLDNANYLQAAIQQQGTEKSSDRSRLNGNEAAQQHAQAAQRGCTCQGFGTCNPGCDDAAPAQPIAGELPPLPQFNVTYADHSYPAYNKKAMITYGHQCRAAGLEEAETICLKPSNEYLSHEELAAAIRALNKTEGA